MPRKTAFTPNTQVSRIADHLEAGKSITPAIAMAVYGIVRLASVIEDLRQAGYEIDTMLKRDEMGKQYGEYRLRRTIVPGCKVQVRPGYGTGLPSWIRRMRGGRVVTSHGNTYLVRFQQNGRHASEWLANFELVRIDD